MTRHTVAVVCRVCLGDATYCGWCKAQGHELINRLPNGDIPETHDTGEPVVEWNPPTLPDTLYNPLVTMYRTPRG